MNLGKDELRRILEKSYERQLKWLTNRPNLLSTRSLAKLHKAFKQGAVFGLHMHYAGGCSPDLWAFLDFDPLIEYLARSSRPGDWFFVWSLKDLEEKKLILAHGRGSPNTPTNAQLISGKALQRVRQYLNVQYHEIFNLYISWDNRTVAAEWGDLDMFGDLDSDIRSHSHPNAEIYVLPFTDIDKPEHHLLAAKFPNEKGQVPLGGPY